MLLKIPRYFRDRWFSARFSQTLEAPLRGIAATAVHELVIDFSECEWADPTPLMALLCELWTLHRRAPALKLEIAMGHCGAGTASLDARTRTRRYLAKHGFLTGLVEACPTLVFFYDTATTAGPRFPAAALADLLDELAQATGGTLVYHPEPVCKPRFLPSHDRCGAISNVKPFVDDIIQTMDDALFRARVHQFGYRDNALVRLRQVATEIISNVCEHAYSAEMPGPACVYARLREGRDRVHRSENEQHCPRIGIIQDVSTERYVELFICDIGKGLLNDAKDWYLCAENELLAAELKSVVAGQAEVNVAQRQRKLMNLLFRQPVSRYKRNMAQAGPAKSNVTGLLHISKVLSRHNDRSRIAVDVNWIADRHALDAHSTGSEPRFQVVTGPGSVAPKGTFFHFALSLAVAREELDKRWLHARAPDASGFRRLREALLAGSAGVAHTVLDLRPLLDGQDGGSASAASDVELRSAAYFKQARDLCIVRVSRYFPKNLHDRLILQWIQECGPGPMASRLVFCDLSHTQSLVLADHLAVLKPQFASEVVAAVGDGHAVCLLSEDLIACRYLLTKLSPIWYPKSAGAHARAAAAPRQAMAFNAADSAPDPRDLIVVLRALRTNDSLQFWARIGALATRDTLMTKDVVWEWADRARGQARVTLPVYLDYALAGQDRELAKIIRRALRRALAAFPEGRPIAVDELVAPDLADALRWRPTTEVGVLAEQKGAIHPHWLFVISSLATGATIARKRKQLGPPVAVLSCLEVHSVLTETGAAPAVPLRSGARAGDWLCYSALEWHPPARAGAASPRWERVPDTPFIRPFLPARADHAGGTFLQPLARQFDAASGANHAAPNPDQSYKEWHRSGLMKIGHWQIGQRHGLIEIDHARTLQRAAESRASGDFYGWLETLLIDDAAALERPILVYPAGRLTAIMVRYLLHKSTRFSRQKGKWEGRVVPINFLPSVGGGLKQISPLTQERIKQLPGARGATVYFVDIGFVGHRTFRHTKRQLLALGVERVVGVGLLNRTSFPAITNELDHIDAPRCYWRLDVPTLNDERSCSMCRGIVAMKELQVRVEQKLPSWQPVIERIIAEWQPRDPNLDWWEHGLEPTLLRKALTKKFGFAPPAHAAAAAPVAAVEDGQLSLFDPAGAAAPALPDPDRWTTADVRWHHVTIENSVQAAAYAIEIARTTSQPGYPWRFANALADDSVLGQGQVGIVAAIEVCVSHLLLCCSTDTAVAVREQGARCLITYLGAGEALVAAPQAEENQGTFSMGRLRALRALAALALMNLDDVVKWLVFDDVAALLERVKLINPETCCALMSVTIADPAAFSAIVARRRDAAGVPARGRDLLEQNFQQINLAGRQYKDQFADALAYFGQAMHHGHLRGEIQTLENAEANARAQSPSAMAALVAMLPRLFMVVRGTVNLISDSACPGPLFRALLPAASSLPQQLKDSMAQIASVERADPAQQCQFAPNALKQVASLRNAFHAATIRIDGEGGQTVAQRLRARVEQIVAARNAASAAPLAVAIICSSGQRTLPGGARYVLFGSEIELFITSLLNEAAQHGAEAASAPPERFTRRDAAAEARCWIILDVDTQGPRIGVWNRGGGRADAVSFSRVKEGMLRIHRELGARLVRRVDHDHQGDAAWYVTDITLRCIEGGD